MMERFQVGDIVQHADGDLGKVLDTHGDTRVRVQWERDGDLWGYCGNVTLVSRPKAEAEPRPFQVGDRVRWTRGQSEEPIFGTVELSPYASWTDAIGVRWDCNNALAPYAADAFTLVTPAPPVTLQGDAAVLPTPTTEPPKYECEGPTAADVERMEAEARRRMPGNELGFPRMPEPTPMLAAPCECGTMVTADTVHYHPRNDGSWCCKGCHDAELARRSPSEQPFDAFMATRASRVEQGPEPRVGDLVRAHVVNRPEPSAIEGVVVAGEPIAYLKTPHIFVRDREGEFVCKLAGAVVLVKREVR
jgi:hypothetical protein